MKGIALMSVVNQTSKINLNSRADIAQFDKENMLGSIEALNFQIEHAWDEVKQINFKLARQPNNLVVAGMGGSGLGADVIKHLFKDRLEIPFDFVHSYTLPVYVDQKSLVILSSYSGNTEEVIQVAEEAIKRQAQIIVITGGGKLYQLAQKHHWPVYKIDPKFNPSNQPRMAIGYSVFGTLGLCAQAGIIQLSDETVKTVSQTIAAVVAKNTVEVAPSENAAKSLAFMMLDHRTVLVGAEFLEGALHVSANQANENAKTFTDYKVIPEMDHHLLEGLNFPKNLTSTHLFLLFQSQLYRSRNQKRIKLTQQIIDDHNIETLKIDLTAATKLSQLWEAITLMALAIFYQAMLEGINPSPIPYVESFKKELNH